MDGIELAIADGVATITLNRPDAGNAFGLPMAAALHDAARAVAGDPAVRCVVMTGAGRMFCAGGDVAAMHAAPDRAAFLDQLVGAYHAAIMPLIDMGKPLLSLVNGPAAGAGLSLAIMADVVLAARSASFLAAYGGVGLAADGGMSWLLPRLAGLRAAQRILLLGEKVDAEEAQAIGLVTRVVADEALAAEGAKLAARLAAVSRPAYGQTRALIRASFESDFSTQLAREQAAMVAAAATPECGEGIAAFLDRRKPDFTKDFN